VNIRDVNNVGTPTHPVEASCLSKNYGNRFGLKDASFEVRDREVFGLIGPNGAGKSTLLRVLATLTRPTSGEAKIFGHDIIKQPRLVRRIIGVVLHQSLLYDEFSGKENLSFYLRLYGLRDRKIIEQKIVDKASIFGVNERLDDQVRTLSSGLKKRLDIVRATIHSPRLLLLDEPFAGLDREGVDHLKKYLSHARENSAIVLSTHSLDIAKETSDRIATLRDGRIMEIH